MYFKRIELNGFKSFADPTTIEFTDGITCIVGPNGSGKSNISDAIRWVLGEQSPKMLRGNKMDEVIFAGTQNRKPKGMAEVTLVIDNADHILPIDYTEVGITRRMYRSGESEYQINRTPCRLKDIRELIMDTGIGVEGYSIIGQGRIADIISDKMDSRREIFEEAAGIVKYRNKKEEAQRKLAAASGNLDRVNDIIREIEDRIGGLKEDSEKAAEYLDIKKKYTAVEVNIILNNVAAAEEKSKSTKEELSELEKLLGEAEKEKQELENALAQAKENSRALDDKINELHNELVNKSDEAAFISNRQQLNAERLTTLENNKISIGEDIENLKSRLAREESVAEDTVKAGEAVKEEQSAAESILSEKQQAVEYIEKVEAIKIKQGSLSARARLLDDLEKSYEGYNGSVRFMMGRNLPGVFGVLGDMVIVPKGCEVAVETALGTQLQDIVCRDDSVAKKAISILKENKAGRLTFLPVESLDPQPPLITDDIEGEPGYMGLASEMVTIKGGYGNVIDYTLGRVVICDKLDNAIRMSALHAGPFRFVTLEGEIVNAAGAITGGSLKNNTGNILSRKAEHDELISQIKLCDDQIADVEDKSGLKLAGSLENIRFMLSKARAAQTEAMLAVSNAKVKAEGSRELANRVNASLEEIKAEIKAKEQSLEKIEKEKSDIALFAESAKLAMADKEKERDDVSKAIELETQNRDKARSKEDEIESQRSEFEKKLYDLQFKKHDADNRMARFDTQMDNLKEKLWDEFEMSFAEAAELEDPDFVMSRGMRESREYRDRLRQLGDVNVGAIEEYKQVSERYEFLTAQRTDLAGAIDELNSVIADTDTTITKRFKESFEAVVENFEASFIELFRGGHARLTLDNPDNPLESGIEIEAQPPGKKLQNINLLSGGEKTMTAIALMFAVLKAKPTPFCILDEVEAALDETNIDCFAKYLQKFDETQFALVTHQKATMEYADVLYGVTMPEHGITKVLSLRVGDDFEM